MNVQVSYTRCMPRPSDDPPWLSPEELEAWRGLLAMLIRLPPALDAQLQRDTGINHFEYGILAALSESPERTLRMSQLAGLANGSQSRLSHAAGRLEQRGWISRAPAAGNRRVIEASLTDAGWRAIEKAAPHHVREVRRLVIDALTPEQITALVGIGRSVLASADPAALAWLDSRELGDAASC
jgi:DNA-binding MarR family transcriptional regulator